MRLKAIIILAFILCINLLHSQNTLFQDDFKRSDTTVFDYSTLNWLDAFDSLHACMSLRYPYTEWKAIDWPSKKNQTRPLIVNAMNANDTAYFIRYLFEYLYEIPDGHINLLGNINSFKKEMIHGSYGFNMIPGENGDIMASLVPDLGPAYAAGIRTGDKILKWNNISIDSVPLKEYLNYNRNYGTIEGRLMSRYLMLSRDKIGNTANVTYESQSTGNENTLSLQAINDYNELYVMGFLNTASISLLDTLVSYKVLSSGIGYLRISAEDSDGMTLDEVIQSEVFLKTAEAINHFNSNNIDKLIIDLRFNMGGNDLLATALLGLFYNTSTFYEHITGTYEDNYAIQYTLYVEPQTPQYSGEIAVLLDPNCISSGEGMALMLQKLANAQIISSWGTNGAYGIVDFGPVFMPAGLIITFPQAISLDQNLNILLESDFTMHGGVSPDIIIPLTVDNIKLQWEEGHDVQLENAISYFLGIDEEIFYQQVSVFPNPCKDILYIKLPEGSDEKFNMSFYDLMGKEVFQKQINHKGENNPYDLNIQSLIPGMYICFISDGTLFYQCKILVR